jgi:hypothetical protein
MLASTSLKAYPVGGTGPVLPKWSLPNGGHLYSARQGIVYSPTYNRLLWVSQNGNGVNWDFFAVLPTGANGTVPSPFPLLPTTTGTSFVFNAVALNLDSTVVYALYDTNLGSGLKSYLYGGGSVLYGDSTLSMRSMVMDPTGTFLYVTQQTGNAIIKVTTSGSVSSFVTVTAPNGLTMDGAGNLYVGLNGSNVVRVTPAGAVTTYSLATFGTPSALAYDVVTAMLAVGDSSTGTVYGVSPSGSTVPLTTGVGALAGISAMGGRFYIYDAAAGVRSIVPTT